MDSAWRKFPLQDLNIETFKRAYILSLPCNNSILFFSKFKLQNVSSVN